MTETLVLIDGHALAYRMYHALINANFSTASGEPTGATFGFTRTLLDIILSDDPPDYIAVSFDVGETFRDEIYEPYKATREEIPPDLDQQVGRIHDVLDAFNIPVVEIEGYEADDVLGTISRIASAQGLQTTIVTSDSDLLQLIDENTTVNLHTPVGLKIYDLDAVEERYGLTPTQLIDYKALVGDTSDNIPGVRGVGDKTATKLLKQYSSMQAIYDNLSEVSSTRARNALEAGQADAELSYKLVTIEREVPIDFELEKCRTRDFDLTVVLELLQELEFRSLIRRLVDRTTREEGEQLSLFGDADGPTLPEDFDLAALGGVDTTTILVQDEDTFAEMMDALKNAERIAFDTETTSVDQMRAELVGISLAVAPETAYYIPVGHQQGEQLTMEWVIAQLRSPLGDESIPKYAHNAKYDSVVLQRHGLIVTPLAYDTMIAEWLIDPGQSVGLKAIVKRRLDVDMTEIEDLLGKGKSQITMDAVSINKAAPYAAADADFTLRLADPTRADMEERGVYDLFTDVEMPLVPIIGEMEQTGILLDSDLLHRMSDELGETLTALSQTLYQIAGYEFNLNSTQQLSEVLFDKLGLPTDGIRKTKSGHYSTAAYVLESLADKDETGIIKAILEYRSLEKLRSTYLDALPQMVNPQTGRIHTSFNQTGTVTGRLSSSDPNLQNIPIRTEIGRRVRDAFIAAPGHVLLAADYSQIELRILADMSGDEKLRQAFQEGQDIHATTAAAVFGVPIDEVKIEQRSFAKAVNFGLLYGMGAYRLARDSDMSRQEAQTFIDTYFERFPSVRGYLDTTKQQAIDLGYVETLLGRRRYFDILRTGGGHASQRRAAEREAINMPIQGTAADIIKIAMVKLHRALQEGGFKTRMVLQVHDELVLEVPEDEADAALALVREVMENAYPIAVPLKVEAHTGQNWGQLK